MNKNKLERKKKKVGRKRRKELKSLIELGLK
jgi:hypothetical protein